MKNTTHFFRFLVLFMIMETGYFPTTRAELTYTFNATSGLLTIAGDGTIVEAEKVNEAINRIAGEIDTSLKQIDFSNATGITTIGDEAFKECSKLTNELIFPSSLAKIGGGAFQFCKDLSGKLVLPEGVTSIDNSAFYGCNRLSGQLILPSTLNSIGGGAFLACSGFSGSLTIPAQTTIGEDAFRGCSSITSLHCLASTPPALKSSDPIRPAYPFNETGIKVLYVPKGKVADYKSATGWSYYASTWTFLDNNDEAIIHLTQAGTLENGIKEQSGKLPAEITKLTITGSLNETDFYFMKSKMPLLNNIDMYETDVTAIPNSAFEKKNLLSFRFPKSLVSIGDDAFRLCGLTGELSLPSSVRSLGYNAFGGCTGLIGTLTLPASLQIINSAFSGCSGFTSIDFPASIQITNFGGFGGCSGLTGTLTLPSSVRTIEQYAFNECNGITSVVLPDSLKSIGYWAFLNCANLTGPLTLPPMLEVIDESAFMGCKEFTSLVFPASIQFIGRDAFAGYETLTDITCLSSVQPQIGREAFAYGPKERTLNVPNATSGFGTESDNQWGATRIEYASFNGWSYNPVARTLTNETITLHNITADNGNQLSIGNNSTGNYQFSKESLDLSTPIFGAYTITSINSDAFRNCINLTSITLPSTLQTLGTYAFEGCTGLTHIVLPASLNAIGKYAFNACSGLTALDLSGCTALETIEEGAFSGCSKIETLAIPASVNAIGSNAFLNCTQLNTINYDGPDQPTIGINAFSAGPSVRTLHLPNATSGFGTASNNQWGATRIEYAAIIPAPEVEERTERKAVISWDLIVGGKSYFLNLYADASKQMLMATYEFNEQGSPVVRTVPKAIFVLQELEGSKAYYIEVETKNDVGAVISTQNSSIPPFTPTNSHSVAFDTQGGTAIATDRVESGRLIIAPVDPTRSGYHFKGWYKESTCNNAWNFATDKATSEITLYAKWELNTGLDEQYKSEVVVYGTIGAIVIDALPEGEVYSVYTMSGTALLPPTFANGRCLTIPTTAGLYVVNTSGKNIKVMVK